MHLERSILTTFFGNYLINNVVAAVVALVPAGAAIAAGVTPQYVVFVVLAAIVVGGLTWWCGVRDLRAGIIFGVVGFLVAIATAFISGISGVILQTGSFSNAITVLPNFVPFLISVSTLVLLAYWIIPAALVGWYLGRAASAPSV